MAAPVAGERGLRADAQRNLELIVEAAEEAFAEHGHEASVADIAQRAGVGQATIFRRFETKDDLIAAVFERKILQLLEAAQTAAKKERAWDGLEVFMVKATQLHARDRGFFQGMAEHLMTEPRILALKKQAMATLSELVARAKAEGDLRADVVAEDIPAFCCAAAQAAAFSQKGWKRYLRVMMDGLRA